MRWSLIDDATVKSLLPSFRPRRGIALVLTLSMVAVIALLMVITTVLDIRRERTIFREGLQQRALLLAETLNEVLADSLYFTYVEELEDLAELIKGQPDILYIQIFTPDGRLLVDTEQGNYPVGMVRDGLRLRALQTRQTLVQHTADTLDVATSIILGNEVIGGAQIGYSTHAVKAEISALTTQRIWQFLALTLIGVVLSSLMAQYFVRPVRRLVTATQRISHGQFDFASGSKRTDEIGDLTAAFADMTLSLQASRCKLEERATELRTALQQLRLEMEERERAEEALKHAHDELEVRVAQRTAQLSRTNEALQQEIAERRRAEQQIKVSLIEKEVLLKEINHRVKNNLQLICSLLSLQSGHTDHVQAREGLKVSQARVKSMALIHENLYQSEDLARVDLRRYVRRLASSLFNAHEVSPDAITQRIEVDDVSLGVTQAIPCGLIINELVSNSLKHAFPEGKGGEIRIELTSIAGNGVTLKVGDSGVGFPSDLDFRNTESLGLQLVIILVDQLDGTIELHANDGTEFEITFPQ